MAPYAFLFLLGCGLLSLLVVRFADHGLAFLTAGRGDLRPAVAALVVIALGTGLAIRALVAQLRATKRLQHRILELRMTPPAEIERSASAAGLVGRLDVVDADSHFSFAYGLFAPRVVVSRGLAEGMTDDQLDAVLAHECQHVRNLDPIKVLVARVVSSAYFLLPALHGLRSQYSAASELAADRRAIETRGSTALAGALHTVVRGPSWSELSTAAAIGGPELLDIRIAQLESGAPPPTPQLSRPTLVLTGLALAVLALALIATIVSVGGPGGMMDETM